MPTAPPRTGLARIRNPLLRRAAILAVVPVFVAIAAVLSLVYAAQALFDFVSIDLPEAVVDCWNGQ